MVEAPTEQDERLLSLLGEGAAPQPRLGHDSKNHTWQFYFGPSKTRFQTTIKAAAGSSAAAERIAWLCYEQFAAGKTKAPWQLQGPFAAEPRSIFPADLHRRQTKHPF